MRSVTHIVIHCSASPNGARVTIADIDRWHRDRGFARAPAWLAQQQAWLKHVGYHFVIEREGIAIAGRHLDEVGAHVAGSNARSIGVCLIGTDAFYTHQWSALADLVKRLKEIYPEARVCGHRDFSPDKDGDGVIEPWEWMKTCPGFDVATWLAGGMQPLQGHILELPRRPA